MVGGSGWGVFVGAGVGTKVPCEPKNLSCNPAGRLQDRLINPIMRIIPVKSRAVLFFLGENIGQFPFADSTFIRYGSGSYGNYNRLPKNQLSTSS